MEYGANPSIKNKKGKSPRDLIENDLGMGWGDSAEEYKPKFRVLLSEESVYKQERKGNVFSLIQASRAGMTRRYCEQRNKHMLALTQEDSQ